jgi:hypothetical protein
LFEEVVASDVPPKEKPVVVLVAGASDDEPCVVASNLKGGGCAPCALLEDFVSGAALGVVVGILKEIAGAFVSEEGGKDPMENPVEVASGTWPAVSFSFAGWVRVEVVLAKTPF